MPDDDVAVLLTHVARRAGVARAALCLATAGGTALEAGRPLRWYGLRCGDVLALHVRAGGASSFARRPLEPRRHEAAANAAWGQPVPRTAPHFRQPREPLRKAVPHPPRPDTSPGDNRPRPPATKWRGVA